MTDKGRGRNRLADRQRDRYCIEGETDRQRDRGRGRNRQAVRQRQGINR